MALIKFRYLSADMDRHGNVRYYVRKPGGPKVRVRGTPGSVEFQLAYQSALKGTPAVPQPKPVTLGPGTWGRMVHAYLASPDFNDLHSRNTQPTRRRLLNKLVDQIGHMPKSVITEKEFRAGLAKRRHGAAKNFHVTLRGLYRWAVENQHVSYDPTAPVKFKKKATLGHHTWTPDECLVFEARWPVGSTARLAYALARYTAARISDVVQMGPRHKKRGHIVYIATKNAGRVQIKVVVPISAPLSEVLDAAPANRTTFLETAYCKPFTVDGLGNAFRKWCDKAGLPQCSMHGLRKAMATELAEAGATNLELMSILGHSTPEESVTYTVAAERAKMAASGMAKVFGEQNVPLALSRGTNSAKDA